MKKKTARKLAMRALGMMATNHWTKHNGNGHSKNFSVPASECLRLIKSKFWKDAFGKSLLLAVMSMFWMLSSAGHLSGKCGWLAVPALVGLFMIRNAASVKIGDACKAVACEWEDLWARLSFRALVEKFTYDIEFVYENATSSKDKAFLVSLKGKCDESSEAFGRYVSCLKAVLGDYSHELVKAETSEYKPDMEKYRDLFACAYGLTNHLGGDVGKWADWLEREQQAGEA